MSGQRFCEQCGAPLEPGTKFCTTCGARVGGAGRSEAAPGQSGDASGRSGAPAGQPGAAPSQVNAASGQPGAAPSQVNAASGQPGATAGQSAAASGQSRDVFVQSQPQPQSQPLVKKRSAVPVIICVVVLVLVVAAGAFALTDGFTNLPGSNSDNGKTQITRIDAGSSDVSRATSGSASKDKKNKDASKQKSGSSATTAPQKSAEELDRDAAVTFAKTFWTNAVPSGDGGAGCTTIDDWTDRNLALVDPSCALYGEIQSKGMDMLQAEDSCVNATVDSQQGSTVTVTVGVAGHRENPSAGWEKSANFTYRMDIQLNDSDKVVGFTSYYTDPSTGKTYSQSH